MTRHLEQMAAKGWMLRHIGRTFWRYEAIEPKTLHFSATFLEKAYNKLCSSSLKALSSTFHHKADVSTQNKR